MEIVFIRHGVTELNQQGIFCGESVDPPLAADGAAELRAVVAVHPYPGVDRVYCSPSLRCRQTAQIIYPHQTPIVVENLREMAFGKYDGMLATQVHKLPHWQQREEQGELFTMPGGESYQQVSQRMLVAMSEIMSQVKDCKTIAIVSHSIAISRLLARTLTTQLSREEAFCPNGMGYLVEVDPEKWAGNYSLTYRGPMPKNAPRPDMSLSPYLGKK